MANFINFEKERILINVDQIASIYKGDSEGCTITMIQMTKDDPHDPVPSAIEFYVRIPYDILLNRVHNAKTISEL